MEPETRRKVEEMVLSILKEASIEEATEFAIRYAASERLGIDLSDAHSKQIVRNVVESYLLSIPDDSTEPVKEPAKEDSGRSIFQVNNEIPGVVAQEPVKLKKEEDSDRVICKLSNKRNVALQRLNGTTLVSIREYYHKDGKMFPGSKGISLSTEQWSTFKKSVPAIEEAISKLKGRERPELNVKQNEDALNSVVDIAPLEPTPIEIIRFDGKNYYFWAQQMELLLKHLKIDHVLTELCPNVALGEEGSTEKIASAKALVKRWVNDDLMCRRNILSHLSDHLFNLYADRKMTAKELWEELKLVYLSEEFGTKRSQVKKYIEFQLVEEKGIVEQIQNLNDIADSIVAAGISIDDDFHVSVILSKLPPSWKDFCNKLMREEYLPYWKLMERMRNEEESRNGVKRVSEPFNSRRFFQPNKGAQRGFGHTPHGMHWNRSENNAKSMVACHICGRRGHLPKNCWNRSDRRPYERKAEENAP